MLSANQTTGFLNQLYIKNKAIKKPDFLHVDTDSRILLTGPMDCCNLLRRTFILVLVNPGEIKLEKISLNQM